MFFFVLGSLTPLSLILLANSATGNRESIPRQYSSNVSNTNLYWFCKELWHFLAILGYIVIIHWIYFCCGKANHRSYNTSSRTKKLAKLKKCILLYGAEKKIRHKIQFNPNSVTLAQFLLLVI
jgi:hypothetical protein